MARITVTADDGRMTYSERVTAAELESEHFRRHLIERLAWGVEDASVSVSRAARRESGPTDAVMRELRRRRRTRGPHALATA